MGSRPEIEIGPLAEFLGHLGSSTDDLIRRRKGKLHHYTDLAALASIVEKNDLWLTNSRYSNDAEEMSHGRNVAIEAVEEWQGSADNADRLRTAVLEDLRQPGWDPVYICCFCEEGDWLNQWRSYGANGAGVDIEIDHTGFSYLAGADCPIGLMRFWKVYYDVSDQKQRVQKTLDFWIARRKYPIEDRARYAADAIRFFIPTFKNPSFFEEREWRLIFTPGQNCPVLPRFRPARGMLIPYFSLNELAEKSTGAARPLPIESVCVGPSPFKELNVESTRMLLARYDRAGVSVVASRVPYRGA